MGVEKQGQCEPFIKDECKKGFQCTGCRWFLFISFLFFVGSSLFTYFFIFQSMYAVGEAEMEFMLPDYEYQDYQVEEVIVISSSVYELDIITNSTSEQETIIVTHEEIKFLDDGDQETLIDDQTEIVDSPDDFVEEEMEVKPFLMEDFDKVVLTETYNVPVDVLY